MNLAESSIRNRVTTQFFVLLATLAGVAAYFGLGQLEDPTFTVKTVVISTQYPGASAAEVRDEVTEKVETHLQQLPYIDKLRSLSQAGLSIVYMDVLEQYTSEELPQIWDEVRRKAGDAQRELPPGAGPCVVNDDYGDVYGIYYGLSGDGYSYRDLWHAADTLKKQLLLVPGVKRVEIAGDQSEVIYVEIPRATLSGLGLSPDLLKSVLSGQNLVFPAGNENHGDLRLRLSPSGTFATVESIGETMFGAANGRTYRLADIATVTRGYQDPPSQIMRLDGRPSIAVGIANVPGANVPDLGRAVTARLAELEASLPVGMELKLIYDQPGEVTKAVANFVKNLEEAVIIVVAILLLGMGIRSGILMGAVLLLTIVITFPFMQMLGIDLHSVSLGALIIALGMLVDNAIVIADGTLVGITAGKSGKDAAVGIVGQTFWPLFGATIIASLAFAPIGLSPDNTGEFCNSLFLVVGISLMLSWVVAVTVTPLWSMLFLRSSKAGASDPFATPMYDVFRGCLGWCLRCRWLVVAVLVGMMASSVWIFGKLQKSFFPADPKPYFTVDVWLRQGQSIEAARRVLVDAEGFVLRRAKAKDPAAPADSPDAVPEVEMVATYVGQAAMRFLLTYTPADPNPSYGQLIVRCRDRATADRIGGELRQYLAEKEPDIQPRIQAFQKGSAGGAKIEARLIGPDGQVLRGFADRVMEIMHRNPNADTVRTDWGERVFSLRPRVSETEARRAGLTREQLAGAYQLATDGVSSGLYREADRIIPIVVRHPEGERRDPVATLNALVWSPLAGQYMPISQLGPEVDPVAEDPILHRRNRLPCLTVEANPADGDANGLLNSFKKDIEDLAASFPAGYHLEWGGEFESSSKGVHGLAGIIPMAFLGMVAIVVMLFNSVRPTLTIFIVLPLPIIGVTWGLWVMGEPFSFMAILGVLSLSGMMIKNAIVLLDQVNVDIAEGMDRFAAIQHAAVTRARPVMMGALTTVLGMIPLIWDVMFAPMAVSIIFGLTQATVMILVVVPVVYAIVYGIDERRRGATEKKAE